MTNSLTKVEELLTLLVLSVSLSPSNPATLLKFYRPFGIISAMKESDRKAEMRYVKTALRNMGSDYRPTYKGVSWDQLNRLVVDHKNLGGWNATLGQIMDFQQQEN